MTRGEQFLAEARTWIGTPFHERASVKGRGCDCKGLIWGAARELGWPEAETFYARFLDYDLSKGLPHNTLVEGMRDVFEFVEAPQLGDIMLGYWGKHPGHLSIFSGETAIHTQINGKAYVKETALRIVLRVYPLHSMWRWRELNANS